MLHFNAKSIKKNTIKRNVLIIVLFIVSFITLYQGFYNNYFKIVDQKQFKEWQNDSDMLVVGRLAFSQKYGIKAKSGLLGKNTTWQKGENYFPEDEMEWDTYNPYTAQIGLQGLLFGIINKVLPTKGNDTISILYQINCIILICLILLLMFVMWKEINIGASIGIWLSCLLNPWLTISSKSLYWVIWSLFLPMILVFVWCWIEKTYHKENNLVLAIICFLTIFFKSGCGYEFLSTVLIAMELPIIFYAYKYKWAIKKYIKRSLLAGLAGCCGFIMSLIANLWQVTKLYNSTSQAFQDLLYRVAKRTNFVDMEIEQVYKTSLEQPFLKVLNNYLHKENSNNFILLDINMSRILLWMVLITCLVFFSKSIPLLLKEHQRSLQSATILFWCSLLAPISWFFLAKGHSAIHVHINYVLWSIPCVLLFGTIAGGLFQNIILYILNIKRHISIRIIIIMLTLFFSLGWPIYRFYGAWDWSVNCKKIKEQEHIEAFYSNEDEQLSLTYFENKLFFEFDSNITQNDLAIVLHLIPEDVNDLPLNKQESGFDNYDFKVNNRALSLPFWQNKTVCIIELPTYEIKKIKIGYLDKNQNLILQEELPLK